MRILKLFIVMSMLAGWALAQEEIIMIWHDGPRTKKIYMKKNLLMEFSPEKKGHPVVSEVSTKEFLNKQKSSMAVVSPVFSDSPDSRWSRALPGGVIIAFAEGLSAEHVKNLAKVHGLKLEKKLPLLGNIWFAPTPAGMKSLASSESVHGQAGVLWASPNWLENLGPH